MSDRRDDLDDEPRGIWGRIELIAAILLGLAGILTAYAAFQGALEDGDALDKYTESSKLTSDANGYFNDARAQFNQDALLFAQYQTLLLEQANDQEVGATGTIDVAEELRNSLFSAELENATTVWFEMLDTDPDNTPPTPLDLDNGTPDDILDDPYLPPDYVDAFALTDESDAAFADAQKANEDGDKFELASVFLAVALFLAGIASLFKQRSIQLAMLIGSVILILPGLYAIADGKGWI